MRRLFDDTHQRASSVASDSQNTVSFKKVKKGHSTDSLASELSVTMHFTDVERSCGFHNIDTDSSAACESALVRLEKRIQEVELRCEQAKWGGSAAEAELQFGDISDIMAGTL